MRDTDLPLFAWQPPVQIILFPLPSRVGKVRKTAALLQSKNGPDADLYWKQVVSANRKHMERLGLSEGVITSELRAFHDAVQAEMVRRSHSGSNSPKGAA